MATASTRAHLSRRFAREAHIWAGEPRVRILAALAASAAAADAVEGVHGEEAVDRVAQHREVAARPTRRRALAKVDRRALAVGEQAVQLLCPLELVAARAVPRRSVPTHLSASAGLGSEEDLGRALWHARLDVERHSVACRDAVAGAVRVSLASRLRMARLAVERVPVVVLLPAKGNRGVAVDEGGLLNFGPAFFISGRGCASPAHLCTSSRRSVPPPTLSNVIMP